MTTLGSKLPKDDANGLPSIANALLENPHRAHLVIMVVDCGKIVEDVDEETRIPMARIKRIEAVLGSDLKEGERLLRNALSARHGSQELPLDDQRDLFSLFNPGARWAEDEAGKVVLAPDVGDVGPVVADGVPRQREPEDNADAAVPDEVPAVPDADLLAAPEPDLDEEAAARKRADDRIAANQAKRKGRAVPKLGSPFSIV